MVMTLVGLEKIDYFSKKKNEQVKGVTAHFTYQDSNASVVGSLTSTQYAKEGSSLYDNIMQMTVGQKYEPQFEYNVKFGTARIAAYFRWDPVEVGNPKK